jgi:hypothetical protein
MDGGVSILPRIGSMHVLMTLYAFQKPIAVSKITSITHSAYSTMMCTFYTFKIALYIAITVTAEFSGTSKGVLCKTSGIIAMFIARREAGSDIWDGILSVAKEVYIMAFGIRSINIFKISGSQVCAARSVINLGDSLGTPCYVFTTGGALTVAAQAVAANQALERSCTRPSICCHRSPPPWLLCIVWQSEHAPVSPALTWLQSTIEKIIETIYINDFFIILS